MKNHQHSIELIGSRRASKIWWIHTAFLVIEKSILVNLNYTPINSTTIVNSLLHNKQYVFNLALYTIITFPFLFGVMFGDAGHGIILTVFSAYMIIYEQQLSKTKSSNEVNFKVFG